MIKFLKVLFGFLLPLVFLATSCHSNGVVLFGSDLVKYGTLGGSTFGFNVNFISPNKNALVEFVCFDGDNAQNLTVQFNDDTYANIKNLKHSGYYIRLLGFGCTTNRDNVVIRSVTLRVDGQEQTFPFGTPIRHSVKQGEEVHPVKIGSQPYVIMTSSYKNTSYAFEYYTETDVTITDFSFNDFLVVKNATLWINGENKGQLEAALPFSVSAGSHISITCYLDLKDMDNSTYYDSIYCDSQLSYCASDSSIAKIVKNSLISQSVSNEEDAKKAIDTMLSKQ